MKQKKKTKKRNKTNVRNKAWLITTLVIAALFALSLSLTVWSTVSDISPRQLVRDIFRLNQPAGYDGVNLFDVSSVERGDDFYTYDPISLSQDTDYVIFAHFESVEDFAGGDGMTGMLLLYFSNETITDIESMEELIFDSDGQATAKGQVLMAVLMPYSKLCLSTRAYEYKYLTLFTPTNLSEAAIKIKIERGIAPTKYTVFGVGTTELYTPTPTAPTDEDPSPTPLAVGQVEALYLNATAAGDAILRSIENANEATNIYMLREDYEETGAYASIVFVDLSEIQMLVLVKGPDDAQTIIPLWFSASGFDLSALDLEGITTAGWQEAAQGDIAERYGLVGYEIQAVDGPTIKYSAWGNGDPELGKSIVDGLFSSTPF